MLAIGYKKLLVFVVLLSVTIGLTLWILGTSKIDDKIPSSGVLVDVSTHLSEYRKLL